MAERPHPGARSAESDAKSAWVLPPEPELEAVHGRDVAGRGSGSVPVLKHLATIAGHFDVIFCDVWGVLHDGEHAHVAAGEALTRFRALPGARPRRVILISNAPRPSGAVRRMLDRLRIPRHAYDGIVTSGDLARDLVAERLAACPSERIHLLGPDRDRSLLAGLAVDFAGAGEADCVLCTGPFDLADDVVEDYRQLLADLEARGATMICANPDLVVEHGARIVTCAGSIAAAYEAIGGNVVYAGKPHASIYTAALQKCAELDGLPTPPPDRILAIGDAIRTDITGASMAGFASLFIADGIHADEFELADDGNLDKAANWLALQYVKPELLIRRLTW